MKRTPKISEAEWAVMKVLWARAPRSGNEVVDALSASTSWSPRTVKTMLGRLVKKKALSFEEEGRTYLYSPLVDEKDCVRTESRSFLERVYDGAFTPMLAHLLEEEELSAKEIAELRELLDKKERDQ